MQNQQTKLPQEKIEIGVLEQFA